MDFLVSKPVFLLRRTSIDFTHLSIKRVAPSVRTDCLYCRKTIANYEPRIMVVDQGNYLFYAFHESCWTRAKQLADEGKEMKIDHNKPLDTDENTNPVE